MFAMVFLSLDKKWPSRLLGPTLLFDPTPRTPRVFSRKTEWVLLLRGAFFSADSCLQQGIGRPPSL